MNIIISGATRGIGRETALALAADKANNILATGRNREALKSLSKDHSNIMTCPIDIAEYGKYEQELTTRVINRLGHVDVLINMAGLLVPKLFRDFTAGEIRTLVETNFTGPALMIKSLIPVMRDGSHIVNISSMGGFQGSLKYAGLSVYSSSKAAIACLTECLATELSNSGIKVNCLALGAVQTEMFEEAFPGFKAPVSAREMGEFVADFALKGHRFFNGRILPVAVGNP